MGIQNAIKRENSFRNSYKYNPQRGNTVAGIQYISEIISRSGRATLRYFHS